MGLHVDRWGEGYAVFDGKQRLTGAYSNRDIALRAMDRKEDEARHAQQARNRNCLTCGGEFWSTGHGNRMCDGCRGRHSGLDARMVGG
ncbi:hypothetical protein [uncultured Roseovarius sp.]|uniref:hypothetical protein n=1 Tax=uncultured Roseovarius sp. TaxID=293344 RepID=UPI002606CA3B|nr:hypothetical protein [uncultured Roseovarius sp.]